MVMMTAKVNKKRVILVLAALAALIVLICILAKGGGQRRPRKQPFSVATNDARVRYLTRLGSGETPRSRPSRSGFLRDTEVYHGTTPCK